MWPAGLLVPHWPVQIWVECECWVKQSWDFDRTTQRYRMLGSCLHLFHPPQAEFYNAVTIIHTCIVMYVYLYRLAMKTNCIIVFLPACAIWRDLDVRCKFGSAALILFKTVLYVASFGCYAVVTFLLVDYSAQNKYVKIRLREREADNHAVCCLSP